MAKTYDPECYNLAEHFLQNEPLSDDKIELAKACVDLAQHIQQAIEDWFDTPAVVPSCTPWRGLMHIISDKSLKRPGYTYERTQGGFVGYPTDFRPAEINWKHIDGPLLYLTNGQLHWLTYRERIQLFFGWTDIHELDMKHQRRA